MADDCAHFQHHPRFVRLETTVGEHDEVLRGKKDDSADSGLVGKVAKLAEWRTALLCALSSMATLIVNHLLSLLK